MWDSFLGGVQVTDLLDSLSVPAAVAVADANGFVRLYGPDGFGGDLYAEDVRGTRYVLHPADLTGRLVAAEGTVAAAAAAAEAAAGTVSTLTDIVGDGSSLVTKDVAGKVPENLVPDSIARAVDLDTQAGRVTVVESAFANSAVVDLAGPGYNLDSGSAITSALVAALAAATGSRRVFRLPAGDFTITQKLLITQAGVGLLGAHEWRPSVTGGTRLLFNNVPASAGIQLGTDSGNPYDQGEYNGPGGLTLKDIALKYNGSMTALANGAGSYGAGSYGVRDWRGGDIIFDRVTFENWDYSFWGVQSDMNRFRKVETMYCHSGMYFGPRSDQSTIHDLHAFYCDRVVEVDGATDLHFFHPITVDSGNATTAPWKIHASAWGNTARAWQVVLTTPWFEHLGTVVAAVPAFIEAGGSSASPAGQLVVARPYYYTESGGGTHHTRAIVQAGNIKTLIIEDPSSPAAANLERLVEVVGANSPTVDLTVAPHMSAVTPYVNSGTGAPLVSRRIRGTGPLRQDSEFYNGSTAYREPFTRFLSGANLAGFVSGVEHLQGIYLRAGDVVAKVRMISGATGLTVGTNNDGHLWATLRDPSGTLIAQSPDSGASTAWAPGTTKDFAFPAPYTVPVDGWYYVGLMINFGTGGTPVMPTMRGMTLQSSTASSSAFWPTGAKMITATAGTGLTTTAPAGPVTFAAGALGFYFITTPT